MIFSRNKDVIKRNVGGEVFLIPIKNRLADMDSIYALHGIAEFIWDRLNGTQDTADICAAIIAEFEVTQKQAMADLNEIINDLLTAGLIVKG